MCELFTKPAEGEQQEHHCDVDQSSLTHWHECSPVLRAQIAISAHRGPQCSIRLFTKNCDGSGIKKMAKEKQETEQKEKLGIWFI
jgi:hypothetical protein